MRRLSRPIEGSRHALLQRLAAPIDGSIFSKLGNTAPSPSWPGPRRKISETYLGQMLRLTLLAPAIIEKIANAPTAPLLSMEAALKPFPPLWKSQMTGFGRA